MLARSSRIVHPHSAAADLQTPLLIPSFSSKGFGVDSGGDSRVAQVYRLATEFLYESMLLSAYDIHYKFLPTPKSAIAEVTVIDSGGYEVMEAHDLSEPYRYPIDPKPWDVDRYRSVLDQWPEHVPAAAVSFDHPERRIPLEQQVAEAESLFADYPEFLHIFLVKPETDRQDYIQWKKIQDIAESLGEFDIIGLTEKELGSSLFQRMRRIAEMRKWLDKADIDAPLHVFGGLDPISSTLYFLAGAEVFDGLTWLRYGFTDGSAMYTSNYGAREVGVDRRDDLVRAKAMQNNLSYLTDLGSDMRLFLIDREFTRFGVNSSVLERAYDMLRAEDLVR